MNTNKALVADVTSKTQTDILQDSLRKTDFEFQDAEVVTLLEATKNNSK